MRKLTKSEQLFHSMKPGKIYRQSELQSEWANASHDLRYLVDNGLVNKVSAGLYYRPKVNEYGAVAPKDEELIESFLQDDDFLIIDVNAYTSLVGGLTQLAMGNKVLNKRRHGHFKLAGFPFDFKVRRAFPKKVTKEFLMVDLLDNLKEVEDGTPIKEKVLPRLNEYDSKVLLKNASMYGNRSTEKFLKQVLQNE